MVVRLTRLVVPTEQSIAHMSRSGGPAVGIPRRLSLQMLRSGHDGAGWAGVMVVLQDDASRGRMPVMGGVRVGVVAGSRVITVRVGDTEIEARRLWCPRRKAQPSSSHLRIPHTWSSIVPRTTCRRSGLQHLTSSARRQDLESRCRSRPCCRRRRGLGRATTSAFCWIRPGIHSAGPGTPRTDPHRSRVALPGKEAILLAAARVILAADF